MTRRLEIGLAIVAIVGLFVVYYWTHATTSIDPPTAVTETPEELAAVQQLCNCAPLESFGSACQKLTWDYDLSGMPRDFRNALPASCRYL